MMLHRSLLKLGCVHTCLVALVATVGLAGCGDETKTTGGTVKPDENAAKRQKEMEDYYKTNAPSGLKKK
ncbi:MAG: hypothetical protein P4L84_31345 [Isosphaeraceae bacterium]|nr:hypothetical protein [Isosphaeraceae bacterium]